MAIATLRTFVLVLLDGLESLALKHSVFQHVPMEDSVCCQTLVAVKPIGLAASATSLCAVLLVTTEPARKEIHTFVIVHKDGAVLTVPLWRAH